MYIYYIVYSILILFPRYHLLTPPPLQLISTSPSSIFKSSHFLVSYQGCLLSMGEGCLEESAAALWHYTAEGEISPSTRIH